MVSKNIIPNRREGEEIIYHLRRHWFIFLKIFCAGTHHKNISFRYKSFMIKDLALICSRDGKCLKVRAGIDVVCPLYLAPLLF